MKSMTEIIKLLIEHNIPVTEQFKLDLVSSIGRIYGIHATRQKLVDSKIKTNYMKFDRLLAEQWNEATKNYNQIVLNHIRKAIDLR